jgi:hypothetical protein
MLCRRVKPSARNCVKYCHKYCKSIKFGRLYLFHLYRVADLDPQESALFWEAGYGLKSAVK